MSIKLLMPIHPALRHFDAWVSHYITGRVGRVSETSLTAFRVFQSLAAVWMFLDVIMLIDWVQLQPWSVSSSSSTLNLFWLLNSQYWVYALAAFFILLSVVWAFGFWEPWAPLLLFLGMASANAALPSGVSGGNAVWLMLVAMYLLRDRKRHHRLRDPAYTLMKIQLVVIYLSGALLKYRDPSWIMGDALAVSLRCSAWDTGLGSWFTYFFPTDFQRFLTWSVMAVESICPLLFFSPWKNRVLSNLAILFLIPFHIGTLFLMHVGTFPLVMVGALLFCFRGKDLIESKAAPDQAVIDAAPRSRSLWSTVLLFVFTLFVAADFQNASLPYGHAVAWAIPGREFLRSTFGFTEYWGMFVRHGATEPLKEFYGTNIIAVLRDREGKLFNPQGEPLTKDNWGKEVLTAQGRGSTLRKTFAEGFEWNNKERSPMYQDLAARRQKMFLVNAAHYFQRTSGIDSSEMSFYFVSFKFEPRGEQRPTVGNVYPIRKVTMQQGEIFSIEQIKEKSWSIAMPARW